ncbi:E4 [Wesgulfec papillomavirus]|nr:E4 [Wesgulfec papillomavirus]
MIVMVTTCTSCFTCPLARVLGLKISLGLMNKAIILQGTVVKRSISTATIQRKSPKQGPVLHQLLLLKRNNLRRHPQKGPKHCSLELVTDLKGC